MHSTATSLIRLIQSTAAKTARLMVGLPDYETYVAHRRQAHPEDPIMSYEEFFCERQTNRYGGTSGKISRCC
jgi:uncharacterized short protein YbdD (DUF466 family)